MHTMCVCVCVCVCLCVSESITIGYDMYVALACAGKTLPILLNPFLATVAVPYADSVVVEITLTCVVLLFLIALTAAGYYFVYRSATVKKRLVCRGTMYTD